MDDKEEVNGESTNLDELAEKELLNEAKRGAARALIYGALGWQKCPLKPTNKVFLQNMILSTISANQQKKLNEADVKRKSKPEESDYTCEGYRRSYKRKYTDDDRRGERRFREDLSPIEKVKRHLADRDTSDDYVTAKPSTSQ